MFGNPSIRIFRTDLKRRNPIRISVQECQVDVFATDAALAEAFETERITQAEFNEVVAQARSAGLPVIGILRPDPTDVVILIFREGTEAVPHMKLLGAVVPKEELRRRRSILLEDVDRFAAWLSDIFRTALEGAMNGHVYACEVTDKEGETFLFGPCFSYREILDYLRDVCLRAAFGRED